MFGEVKAVFLQYVLPELQGFKEFRGSTVLMVFT